MDAPQHRVPIPRHQHPLDDPDRGLIIVAAVMHKMKVGPSSLAHDPGNLDAICPGCLFLVT